MPSALPATTVHPPPSPTSARHHRRASLKVLNRNIDKVVLGNLIFQTWYYSPYPDAIILGATAPKEEQQLSQHHQHQHQQSRDGKLQTSPKVEIIPIENAADLAGKDVLSASINGVSRLSGLPPCHTLHICPYCFRYSHSVLDHAAHLQIHVAAEQSHATKTRRRQVKHRRNGSNDEDEDEDEEGDRSHWPVPSTAIKVYEADGYCVWDIDGEVEKLYCQNLSLFGKLFLEQKSVFFDTAGFHYFVLTYTPPQALDASSPPTASVAVNAARTGSKQTSKGSPTSKKRKNGERLDTSITKETLSWAACGLQTQVLGFFSKENMSWDANNLACILVFPPYQHRNLGQLLMAVSYKLSGWEWEDSIIGGPEKPLSTMGRRSYLRFWTERIARFMMGQTADADGTKVFDGKTRRKVGHAKEAMTVREIGDRTGMLPEDVIAALNEMGLCEAVPPKRKKKAVSDEGNASQTTAATADESMMTSMTMSRAKILAWAQARHINLSPPVREEGFLGEWALSDLDSSEVSISDQNNEATEG